jgi:hypothetical protein
MLLFIFADHSLALVRFGTIFQCLDPGLHQPLQRPYF